MFGEISTSLISIYSEKNITSVILFCSLMVHMHQFTFVIGKCQNVIELNHCRGKAAQKSYQTIEVIYCLAYQGLGYCSIDIAKGRYQFFEIFAFFIFN